MMRSSQRLFLGRVRQKLASAWAFVADLRDYGKDEYRMLRDMQGKLKSESERIKAMQVELESTQKGEPAHSRVCECVSVA